MQRCLFKQAITFPIVLSDPLDMWTVKVRDVAPMPGTKQLFVLYDESDKMNQQLAPVPIIRCYRTGTHVLMNGCLADPCWRTAENVTLRLNETASQASYNTSVRCLWDDHQLYVGFDCQDPEPIGRMTQRDDLLWKDGNVVEIFIDPAGQSCSFFEFEVNPLNTLLDLFFERLDQPWKEAILWDAKGIETGVKIQHNSHTKIDVGWSVTFAIPWANFHTAKHQPPRDGDTWRINFYRYNTLSTLPGDGLELYAWSPTYRKKFDVPERFGMIHFCTSSGVTL